MAKLAEICVRVLQFIATSGAVSHGRCGALGHAALCARSRKPWPSEARGMLGTRMQSSPLEKSLVRILVVRVTRYNDERRAMATRLKEWADLKDDYPWETLVVGNGLSINIWRDFAYSRLFEQASLDCVARRLFSEFDTENFEAVLEALWHAEKTLSALDQQTDVVTKLYEKVQSALFQAVRKIHVPWRRIDRPRLQHIFDALRPYRSVFTLNYDLLTYWAAMQRGANLAIRDFFWSDDHTFDDSDATLAEDVAGLFYLHGGIHLWQDSQSGRTGKWTTKKGSGVTLLSSQEASVSSIPSRRPLFVSEGTSAQKMAVIRRSDYLSYALQTLSDNTSNTVIFGASFRDQDKHIATAIASGPKRHIAISVRPGTQDQNDAAIANYRASIPRHRLHFFDSTSHPLGVPSLTVH
jgi:hypothetical protein